MEHHFARRLARRANDNQGADLFTDVELIIQVGALFARVWCICRMNRGARTGTRSHLVRGARVVTIGQQNSADTKARNLFEICGRRFHGIDAEISARVENEVTVEVVAVRFRKPRPSPNAA